MEKAFQQQIVSELIFIEYSWPLIKTRVKLGLFETHLFFTEYGLDCIIIIKGNPIRE